MSLPKFTARRFGLALALALASPSLGCLGKDQSPPTTPVLPAFPDAPPACKVETLAPADAGNNHAPVCSPLQHATNPPSSGTHYPTWAFFRAYDKPVPWGFLLHALEHGAVVVAYNCPEGCAAEVAEAKAMMEATPRKSACAKPRPPVIVVPDPKLDVRFAAAAWGHVLRADCFDLPSFTRFVYEHMNKGPEYFPSDCGATDLEATGWCPGG